MCLSLNVCNGSLKLILETFSKEYCTRQTLKKMKSQCTTGYYNDQATVHMTSRNVNRIPEKIPLKVDFVRFSVVNKGQIGGIGKTCALPRGLTSAIQIKNCLSHQCNSLCTAVQRRWEWPRGV